MGGPGHPVASCAEAGFQIVSKTKERGASKSRKNYKVQDGAQWTIPPLKRPMPTLKQSVDDDSTGNFGFKEFKAIDTPLFLIMSAHQAAAGGQVKVLRKGGKLAIRGGLAL